MTISDYLQRLRYAGTADKSLSCLQALHYQHLLTVPLENLDVHWGREISLETDALFDKLITRRRGGFCYELNGLFYELLHQLGFQVSRLSARVYEAGKGFNAEFDHLAILANLDGVDWLVDVGFGRRFPLYPLRVVLNQVQEDPGGRYLITQYDAHYLALNQQVESGDWVIVYIFSLTPREPGEFTAMCRFHQTSEDSYFTQNKLCTIVTEQGRITLTDDKLRITKKGQTFEEPVVNSQHFAYLLANYFGIKRTPTDAMEASVGSAAIQYTRPNH